MTYKEQLIAARDDKIYNNFRILNTNLTSQTTSLKSALNHNDSIEATYKINSTLKSHTFHISKTGNKIKFKSSGIGTILKNNYYVESIVDSINRGELICVIKEAGNNHYLITVFVEDAGSISNIKVNTSSSS